MTSTPTCTETVYGGLLQDIGKLMQRAHGSLREMNPSVRDRESDILPNSNFGGYTHKHVLWTEAFFQWMEDQGLAFPKGVNRAAVRNMAVFHHRPEAFDALGWLAAKADRYSSAMDRKPAQERYDTGDTKAWDTFRKTPLRSVFDYVDLGRDTPTTHSYKLDELAPDQRLIPQTGCSQDSEMPNQYAKLWAGFCRDFAVLCKSDLSSQLFEEALLGLLERYTWAVPSSTVDVPDISLFDHSKTVAAIAAALYKFHANQQTLNDVSAVKNDEAQKFVLVGGDLSGIQSTLFTLESQGVRGVGKILRARSFLLSAIVEAAALRILTALSMPLSSLLMLAGGRFMILLPNIDGVESKVEELRRGFDQWLVDQYTGSLSLGLAFGTPFPGSSFAKSESFIEVLDDLSARLDEAKQRPLGTIKQGTLAPERGFEYGACAMCGRRPALSMIGETSDGHYCGTCAQEYRIGLMLTRRSFLVWSQLPMSNAPDRARILGLELNLMSSVPERLPSAEVQSVRQVDGERSFPWAWRYLANYVPEFKDDYARCNPIYAGMDDDQVPEQGQTMTFAHIAAHAKEPLVDDEFNGKAFLAVLKADVDHLGAIMSIGMRRENESMTLSRFVQLSRMLDLYFTGYLQHLLITNYPYTYTVYAGGDDLLIIGPWRQTLALAQDVARSFRSYTGENGNITLSAGIELMHADMPVNRAVDAADERLDRAKASGRDRVCAFIEEPLHWESFGTQLARSEWVNEQLRRQSKPVSTGFIYHLLQLSDDAARAAKGDISKSNWRARLGYHLRRNVQSVEDREVWISKLGFADVVESDQLLMTWRMPLGIAIYRNRN